jgi:hypothetical protein
MIVALVVVTGLTALWFFLLRPRTGGKHAPPVVTSSPLVPIPVIGHIVEFFRSPHFMMQRCLKDHGKVFTIPVRIYGLRVFTRCVCVYRVVLLAKIPHCLVLAFVSPVAVFPVPLNPIQLQVDQNELAVKRTANERGQICPYASPLIGHWSLPHRSSTNA